MGWMILLMTEKNLVGDKWGDGCRHCRFLNTIKERAECICDERINVYRNGKISDHRPYECPFRYYTDTRPIVKRFDGMTVEETKGFFEGDHQEYEHYTQLEKERDSFVRSETYRRMHDEADCVSDRR